MQRQPFELPHGTDQTGVLIRGQDPRSYLVAGHAGERTGHALEDLLPAHLQRVERDGTLGAGDVLRDVAGEARLADRGAGREDDEVLLLEAAHEVVDGPQTRPYPSGEHAPRCEVDAFQGGVGEVTHGDVLLVLDVARHSEDAGLGAIEQVTDLTALTVGLFDRLLAGADDPPPHPRVMHGVGVEAGVAGGRHELSEGMQVVAPPDLGQEAPLLETLGNGHRVGLFALDCEAHADLEDEAVGLGVEVLGAHDAGCHSSGRWVEHHRPEK